MSGPTIVAAALRLPAEPPLTLSLPPPARHHTIMHALQRAGAGGGPVAPAFWPENQGFLASDGRWVDRREAMRIALASGQSLRPKGPGEAPLAEQLYSEDLW